MKTIVWKLWVALLSSVFIVAMGIAMSFTHSITANAEALEYLDIFPENLTFESEVSTSDQYSITFSYFSKDVSALPQGSYSTYATQNIALPTDDTDTVNLNRVQGGGSKNKITFVFSLSENNGCVGFLDASVKSFYLPDKLTIECHKNYKTKYESIRFLGNIQVNKTSEGWEVVAVPIPPSYEMTIDKDTLLSFGWDETENALVATVALPFAYSENAVYEGATSVEVSGADYAGDITVKHEAESTLLIVMGGSEGLKYAKNIVVTIKGGYIEHELIGDITITGEVTYYGYSDETWSTERYYEIFKTVDGELVLEKILATETEYPLTSPKNERGRSCIGWLKDGNLYPLGETLPLFGDLYLEARFLSFGLEDGASIKYADSEGGSSGIRFKATLQKEEYETHSSFVRGIGIIIMPLDLMESGKEFTLQNYNGAKQAQTAFAENWEITFDKNGEFALSVSVVDILKRNYNRPFIARAYAVLNWGEGSVYAWDSFIETRSVYEVASLAIQKHAETPLFDTQQLKILKSFVNGVANIAYENGETKVVSVLDSPAIQGVSMQAVGESVTLFLETETEYFSAITFNGVRLTDCEQSYAGGILTVKFKWDFTKENENEIVY